MKILLVGKKGQVGWELNRILSGSCELIALERKDLDLAKPDQIRKKIQEIKPGLIINAAAYTAVDQAENEPELAMAVNETAPRVLAGEAKQLNGALIHFSTDYVFDGETRQPYTEKAATNPLNVYGHTKLKGDISIQKLQIPYLIFRTGWVYGLKGENFLLTMQRLAAEKKELRIVDDQVGTPTWCVSIAEAVGKIILNLLQRDQLNIITAIKNISGIYNMTCMGETSWHGFAQAIFEKSGRTAPKLTPVPTTEHPTPATRPKYTVLSNLKLKKSFNIELPEWQTSLKHCLKP